MQRFRERKTMPWCYKWFIYPSQWLPWLLPFSQMFPAHSLPFILGKRRDCQLSATTTACSSDKFYSTDAGLCSSKSIPEVPSCKRSCQTELRSVCKRDSYQHPTCSPRPAQAQGHQPSWSIIYTLPHWLLSFPHYPEIAYCH